MSETINHSSEQNSSAESGEPYDWERCTVRLSITFLPAEVNDSGRQVIIGCNTHNDPPLIETAREAGLGHLPPLIAELLDRLKQRLPEQAALAEAKQQAALAAEEKAKLARQKSEERAKAAGRRFQEKNNQSQKVAPAVVANKLIESSALEDHCAPILIDGEQQSLFG